MKKVAFILNPVSGTRHKSAILEYVNGALSRNGGYEAEFYRTTSVGDACRAAREFVGKKFDIVVAIGGDGTVNEVAEGLINSNVKLGIIPVGSGNGLARHLSIPMSYQRAVDAIFEGNSQFIDAGMINGKVFFCTAGVGFDAVVGNRFNSAPSRGLKTYMEFCAKEYMKYRPEEYEIHLLGNTFRQKAFLITFANSSQWGNNAVIAPDANISDGMMDVVIWREAPKVTVPLLTMELFLRTIKYSEFIDTYRCRELTIIREQEGLIQFDGESMMMGRELRLSVIHKAVEVVVPAGWSPIPQFLEMMPQHLKEMFPQQLKDMVPQQIKDIVPLQLKDMFPQQIKDIVPKLKDMVK